VISGNAALIFRDFPNDPKVNAAAFPLITAEGLKSVIGVPLSRKGRVFGVLMCGYREVHGLTEDDVRLVSNLADQAALAIENAQLYQTTLEHSRNLKALSAKLANVQEEERLRVARELHDGVGQALMGIRLNLDLLCNEVPIREGAGLERVKQLKGIIDETANEIRQIASDLRPAVLDDFGFLSALRHYIEGFIRRAGITVSLHAPEKIDRWDSNIEATLYRVVQEALTNVAKHSGADRVEITLATTPQRLVLDIEDNGTAVDTRNDVGGDGLGILNMRERIAALKGTFTFGLNSNKSARIHIEIPHSNE
jgi:signal transduction histidine kinase